MEFPQFNFPPPQHGGNAIDSVMEDSGFEDEDGMFIKQSLSLLTREHQQKLLERLLQDPLLSDLQPTGLTPDFLDKVIAHETGKAIRVQVRKISGERIPFIIASDTTLRELKKDIVTEISRREEPLLGKKKISWKHVWKNYCLVFEGVRLLEDNKRLYEWGIKNDSELTWTRYRKS
eukprot:TRINITY_DN979_c0_g2_i6.p1 TRINITY_DN979_c0_g2~~TRINITY_DN979_c0_g2_i6.p1  ORF type:complete len:176 (-),score=33.36 TRINITY_DN979_c0_g2_i6:121-648(-)